MSKVKHEQIDIGGELLIHTSDILYIKRCKPYGNEALKESQLMVRLHQEDKIYLNLGEDLSRMYYEKINDILKGRTLVTLDDVKKDAFSRSKI